jgi:hypothetical protein
MEERNRTVHLFMVTKAEARIVLVGRDDEECNHKQCNAIHDTAIVWLEYRTRLTGRTVRGAKSVLTCTEHAGEVLSVVGGLFGEDQESN